MTFNNNFDDVSNETGIKKTYEDSDPTTPSISYQDPADDKMEDPNFMEQLIDDLFLDEDAQRSE